MATIKAFRMDGLGNKFVIVDRRKDFVNITKEQIIHLGNLKSFHRDIGFDQIIFIEREIDKAFPITIFNSDGGEVSACGNGSRCVAYLLGKDLNTKEVKLKTNNRLLNAKIVGDLDVELAMGKPIFEWNKIPLSKNLDHSNITLNIEDKVFTDGFCLNVGNPHIIFFVKDCFEHDLKILGPKIENNKLFPERTNVTFAQVNDSGEVEIEEIKKLITTSIPDASIEIIDLKGDSNHYSATIESKVFSGLSKIEQHKLVYKSLKGKMGNELHALSITTKEKK